MFIAATQIGSGVVLAISLAALSGVVGLVLSRVRADEAEGLVGQEAG
jgi:hypothetical protein